MDKTTWVKCAYWTDQERDRNCPIFKKGTINLCGKFTSEAEAYMNKENQAATSLKMSVFLEFNY